MVGLDFFDQADPTALLGKIDEDPNTFASDHVERHVELIATIAAERLEQVAGEAGGVEAYQRRGHLGGIS